MKKTFLLLFSLMAITFGAITARAEVSVSVFYDSLDSYGDWVEVGDYGYAWSPRDVDSDWRPYADGEWAYTDAGWTWVSDEPYGWAVYHYGRWLRTDSAGWVWVPGEEWGPAWVSWRRSPEYVGWAPLPPEVRFSQSVRISRGVDIEFDIGPSYYSFVTVRNFGAQRLRPLIIEPRRNITIINQTRNITNITYVNKTVFNGGPEYDEISRVSERPIRKLKLNRRTDFGSDERTIQGSAKVSGDSLDIPAPRITKNADAKPAKLAKKISKDQVNRGWKGAGSEEEVAQARAQMKKEESEPAPQEAAVSSTEEEKSEKAAKKSVKEDKPQKEVKSEKEPDADRPKKSQKKDSERSEEPEVSTEKSKKADSSREQTGEDPKPSKKEKSKKQAAATSDPSAAVDEPARKPAKKEKSNRQPAPVEAAQPDRPEPSQVKQEAPTQKKPKAEKKNPPKTTAPVQEPRPPQIQPQEAATPEEDSEPQGEPKGKSKKSQVE